MTPDFWQSVTTPQSPQWRDSPAARTVLEAEAPRIVAAAYREAALRLRDLGLGVASHLMATWATEAEKGVPS